MTAADGLSGAGIQEDVAARMPSDGDVRRKAEYLADLIIGM